MIKCASKMQFWVDPEAYRQFDNELKFTATEFRVKLKDIEKFERQNVKMASSSTSLTVLFKQICSKTMSSGYLSTSICVILSTSR